MNKKDLIRESKKKKSNNGYLPGYNNPSTYEAQKAIGIYDNPAGGIGRFNAGAERAGEMNGSAISDGACSSGPLEEDKFSGGHSKEKFRPAAGIRYVRRYYIKPQNVFCSNKSDVLNALIEFEDQDMTIYTMNNLPDDSKDVTKLTKNDVIYYYEDGILFDKNGVKILPLIKIRDEEKRDEVDVKSASDATLRKVYDDRLTGLSEDINEAFSLDFDSINAYGEKLVEGKVVGGTCCICGEEFAGEPNNAEPYKKGNCCDACYHKFVVPVLDEQE